MTTTNNDYLFALGAGHHITVPSLRASTTVYLPRHPVTGWRDVFHGLDVFMPLPDAPGTTLQVIQDPTGNPMCPVVLARAPLEAAKWWWSTTSWNPRNIWSKAGKATNDD